MFEIPYHLSTWHKKVKTSTDLVVSTNEGWKNDLSHSSDVVGLIFFTDHNNSDNTEGAVTQQLRLKRNLHKSQSNRALDELRNGEVLT